MADLKDIRGIRAQALTSDPDQPGSISQIYYNDTAGVFKALKEGSAADGTWSSGGNLNTARFNMGTSGTQTATLAFAGKTSTEVNNVESYNGSSWSETTEVNQLRRSLGSSGTQTAALAFAGQIPPGTAVTELWNGSTWT